MSKILEVTNFNFLVKTQLAVEKVRVSLQVRNTHLKKQDKKDTTTENLEKELKRIEKIVDEAVATRVEAHPASHWFLRVPGVGKENIAKVIGLIDIKKAPHVSSLWKWAGFHVEDGKAPRRVKGKKITYNAVLKSMVWRLIKCIIRVQGNHSLKVKNRKYYEYYIAQKERYCKRFLSEGYKIVSSNDLPKKNGKKYEPEGVISKGHLDNMALRKVAKLFLSHLWAVWREAENLPVTKPYAIDKLGHNHYYDPWEFVE